MSDDPAYSSAAPASSPPEDDGTKKRDLGKRFNRRNRTGRPLGTRPRFIRERERLMKELGGDPPHVALLKIGRDDKIDLSMRTSALAACAAFFAPKYGPLPPPRFLADAPDLGRLTDASSAVVFVASVVESARTGKLDAEWMRLFIDAADVYVRLRERVELETEVEKHRELALAAE
jgi:hypothetical protein